MALPTHGRVLLDTTAGDIDIELWSKVRHANKAHSCLCKHNAYFAGSTESMPEFHSVGHGRYAPPAFLVRMSVYRSCATLTATLACVKKKRLL